MNYHDVKGRFMLVLLTFTLLSIVHCDECEVLCNLSCNFPSDCSYAIIDGLPIGCECVINNTKLGELIGGIVGGIIFLCLVCCYCCKSNNVTIVHLKEHFVTKKDEDYQKIKP